MHPATMLGLGLVVVSGTIAATYIPWGNAGYEIWHMPEGMGALLGSLFGLIGVGISALVGFNSLIHAQERAARLKRERDEQLAREDAAAVSGALLGELLSIREAAATLPIAIDLTRAAFEAFKRQYGKDRIDAKPATIFPRYSTPIFDAHASRVGVLTPECAKKVAAAYSAIRAMGQLNPEGHSVFPDTMIAVCDMGKATIPLLLTKIDDACVSLKTE